MDGTARHHIKQNKPDTERQVWHLLSYMWKHKNKMTWKYKGITRDCDEGQVGGERKGGRGKKGG
jgi:hypothetical protein